MMKPASSQRKRLPERGTREEKSREGVCNQIAKYKKNEIQNMKRERVRVKTSEFEEHARGLERIEDRMGR